MTLRELVRGLTERLKEKARRVEGAITPRLKPAKIAETARTNLAGWGRVAREPKLRQEFQKYVVAPQAQRIKTSSYGRLATQAQKTIQAPVRAIGEIPIATEKGFFAPGKPPPLTSPQYIRLKEYLQPRAYAGGRVGKQMAADIETTLMAAYPTMAGAAPTVGKSIFSPRGAVTGGTALAGLQAVIQTLKGEKVKPREMVGAFAIGAVFGGVQPKPLSTASKTQIGRARIRLKKYGFAPQDSPAILKTKFKTTVKKIHPDTVQVVAKKEVLRGEFAQFMDDYNTITSAGKPSSLKLPDVLSWIKGLWKKKPAKEKALVTVKKAPEVKVKPPVVPPAKVNPYMKMPAAEVRKDARYGVLLAKEAAKKRRIKGWETKLFVPPAEKAPPAKPPAEKVPAVIAKIKPAEIPTIPGAKVAAIIGEKVPPTPEAPPAPPGVPKPPEATDPVQRVIAALKEAEPIREVQESLYTEERGKRMGDALRAGEAIAGEAGFYAEKARLAEEMPKVVYESIRGKFSQADIDSLFIKIKDTPFLDDFEKITAREGLANLLGAEGGAVPTRGQLELLDGVFGKEFTQAVLDKRPDLDKIKEAGLQLFNLSRSFLAGIGDLSATLRQNIFLAYRHPKRTTSNFFESVKYFADEEAFKMSQKEIAGRPTYPFMKKGKLALTELGGIMAKREEEIMGTWAESIPGLGRLVRATGRAYTGFLNRMRADVFDDFIKNAELIGRNPKKDVGLLRAIADFVNNATGRGGIGALERSAVTLNSVLFSPRLLASRLNLINPYYYVRLDPFVRKEALKTLFAFLGGTITVLALAELAGADVEKDCRSADFGKIKIGNTRLDIMGGFQQPVVLMCRLLTGQMISSTTGKEYTLGEGYKPITRLGMIGKFLASKQHPTVSFFSTWLQGENYIGEKFNFPVEVMNRFIPMVASDAYELYKEHGPAGLLGAIPAILGVGVQTYGKQTSALETTPSGRPTIKIRGIPGAGEDIWGKIAGGFSPATTIQHSQKDLEILSNDLATRRQISGANQDLQGGNLPTGATDQVKRYATAEFIISEIGKLTESAAKEKKLQEFRDAGYLTPETQEAVDEANRMKRLGLSKTDRELFLYQPGLMRAQTIIVRLSQFATDATRTVYLRRMVREGLLDDVTKEHVKSLNEAREDKSAVINKVLGVKSVRPGALPPPTSELLTTPTPAPEPALRVAPAPEEDEELESILEGLQGRPR